VEAALVLPIFLFAILSVIYFLQIIGIQESLQQAITQMGIDSSKYAYVYQYLKEYENNIESDSKNIGSEENTDNHRITENTSVSSKKNIEDMKKTSLESLVAASIDSTYFKVMLTQYVEEDRINNCCIKQGMSGIYTFMSSFMSEGEDIDIIISYSIKLPIPIISLKEIPFLQRVRIRGFNGYNPITGIGEEQEGEDKTYVYITETGMVYHISKECSHLRLTIEAAEYNDIDNKRNDAGGKYYPCSICMSKTEQNMSIYITKSGDRYHSSLNCSGLKRTIFSITLEQVNGRTLCTRCGKFNAN
jgi:hypothetical protein